MAQCEVGQASDVEPLVASAADCEEHVRGLAEFFQCCFRFFELRDLLLEAGFVEGRVGVLGGG
jgi:hypothetical protein